MRVYLVFLLLFCIHSAMGQSLAELENQLDSLLSKKEKSELVAGIGYGNNPAYGSKVPNYDEPLVMKTFITPSLTYYHKSGFYGSFSGYYLFDAFKNPWFEWDFTAGYDYSKNDKFITGVSYTRYFFTDSSDVPLSPIKNETFAYFYYRGWWLQPGVSLDYGWGKTVTEGLHTRETLRGSDFNVITTVRHPFIFTGLLSAKDAVLLTPSVSLTMGTANYFSNLKAFQYYTRTPKVNKLVKHPGKETSIEQRTEFQPRAVDLTVNFSYLIGKVTISPCYTMFETFNLGESGLLSYFTARVSYTF
ncbi:MAG: hypothetical protein JO154_22120 [Chitinophaga sp.]|uniref:hypothetical protein n=1 Tax=Chitinophaga sp. TaxID=1869181 RepID=UPI0025B7EEFE|nr:hypothetical protein [Chitinophaga sp.]MBV8255313.1 hypothetical protein [Chitinophaga sp.]